ncbi:MAG: hypothetical protein QOJ65_1435 [Fimbriimonadaceae bacterium]|nr:hypothetical protein [Fimbriimonadaceae bacterium]
MTRERYPNLDILRLFLAVEVVAQHAYNIKNPGSFLPPIAAVPAFVCLSGFLIPASLDRSNGWGHFAWKRALRVYPALLVSFALVVALFGFRSFTPTLVTYLTMGLVALPFAANGALWSLMVEEVLYAWHVVMRRWWTPKVAVGLLSFAVATWLALRISGLVHPGTQWNNIIGTAASFFVGNVLYWIKEKLRGVSPLLATGALVAVMLAGYVGLPDIVTWPLASALALVTAYRLPQWSGRWVDLSYSVYVYHVPILVALMAFGIYGAPLLVATLAAVLPLAWLSWVLVERPALRWKERVPRFLSRRRTAPSHPESPEQIAQAPLHPVEAVR